MVYLQISAGSLDAEHLLLKIISLGPLYALFYFSTNFQLKQTSFNKFSAMKLQANQIYANQINVNQSGQIIGNDYQIKQ